LVFFSLLTGSAAAQNANQPPVPRPEPTVTGGTGKVNSGALLQVSIPGNKPWKRIPKNTVLEGHLALPVYAGQGIDIPAGTALRLSIESLTKTNDGAGAWKKIGRGLVRAFNPLESSPPPEYNVRLTTVEAILPDGKLLPLKTSVLRAGNGIVIQPQAPQSRSAHDHSQSSQRAAHARPETQQTVLLRLDEGVFWAAALPLASSASDEQLLESVPAARARAFVLTTLSASHSHEGDLFQAQLAEPVRLAGQTFEAGSLLQGRVMRSQPPRMLSRAGSLRLRVDQVTSPQGLTLPAIGSLDRAEADAQARFVLDEEGQLRGLKPGVKNTFVDLGITYALGKAADDIAETPIRAIGAGMGDAAVANAARYCGLGASAIFLVTRHGRDFRLPKYAEIEVDFGRAERTPHLGQ